jgi:hypothetical protein
MAERGLHVLIEAGIELIARTLTERLTSIFRTGMISEKSGGVRCARHFWRCRLD